MGEFIYEENKFDRIKKYDKLLVEYLELLYSTGLTVDDYYPIGYIISSIYDELNRTYEDFVQKYGNRSDRRIIVQDRLWIGGPLFDIPKERSEWTGEEISSYNRDRNEMKRYTKELNSILYEFLKLKEFLKEKLVGYTPMEFIKREASLTHLVYTNNTYPVIKPHSKNSFMFECQLHYEKTPSFTVDNMNRSGLCYGCGKIVDPVSFIQQIEFLSEKDAMSLIASIYNLSIPGLFLEKNNPLSTRYRGVLLSPEFKNLLKCGYERTKKYRHTAQVKLALDTYQRDFDTIERVKNGEILNYHNPEDLPKKLSLILPGLYDR